MKKKLAALVVLVFSITLTACHQKTTSEVLYDKYKQVKITDAVLKSDTKGTTKKQAEELFGKPDTKEKIQNSQVIWGWKKDSVKVRLAFSGNEAYMKDISGLKWDDNKKVASAYSKIKPGTKVSTVLDKCGTPDQLLEASIMNQHNKSYRYKVGSHEYNFIFDAKNKLTEKEMK